MERSFRDHLKDREGWNHSHKGIKTDQDTMIEQGMSGVEKTRSEEPICDRERDVLYILYESTLLHALF